MTHETDAPAGRAHDAFLRLATIVRAALEGRRTEKARRNTYDHLAAFPRIVRRDLGLPESSYDQLK